MTHRHRTAHRSRVGIGRIVAALLVLLVVGCQTAPVASPTSGAGTPDPQSTASTNEPAEPNPSFDAELAQKASSASLIQQAVTDGMLDEITSLEYRVMAMFGIPGLPDEFAGGVPSADSAALAQMAAMLDELSDADQARFQPYLLRPTEPGSIFHAGATATRGSADVQQTRPVQAPAACRTWADSGDLDNRFKVWACADDDPQVAEIDIAAIVVMLQDIWDKMSNDMGGPPKPDTQTGRPPIAYGGDARTDFYALHLGEVVYRDGLNEIPAGAAAAAVPTDPIAGSASSFVLLNADRLETDETIFKQDLIHEFFHALQDAHNFEATAQGTTEHWFVESSATWAETYYMRADSDIPHGWIYQFQDSRLGLQDSDPDHQYASYVWPFFMEQEKGAQAIFDVWKAANPIRPGDFSAMTAVVDAQLGFEQSFRDFAVRNVNLNNVLRPANETRYDELDANFHDDVPPFVMIPVSISPGSPYVSADPPIPSLAAYYYAPEFLEESREITIDIRGLQPGGQVDGDFLAQYADGSSARLPISDGLLKFCRDDDGWDIDSGHLVVSNHSVDGDVSGSLEISAKDRCAGEAIVLQGTIRGTGRETPNYIRSLTDQSEGRFEVNMEVTITITTNPDDWTSTGTASVSGEYTGDCHFSDSDSGQMTPRGMHIFDPADDTDMIAFVEVVTSDPRYSERPLTGLYLSVFGRTAGRGGTCGHVLGPVEDASPELQISLAGCSFFEILNNNGTWHGSCDQEDEINPGTGLPYSEQHWTANLEQISPRESPPGLP